MEVICQNLAKTLSGYLTLFAEAIASTHPAGPKHQFAYTFMGRLLLIYDLQVAGFLAQGDRWYLHNLLSQHAAKSSGTFFKTILQPLCHQGLGLPPPERPRSLLQTVGQLPYLASPLFQPHVLEQQDPHLDLPDEPIEQFLGWLAEQSWQRQNGTPQVTDDAITRSRLAGAFEYLITERTGRGTVSSLETLQTIAQRTIDAHLLRAVASQLEADSLEALLMAMDDATCVGLVFTVLPRLTVLDPACGSGRFLLMVLERLQRVYHACWRHAQQSSDADLQAWGRSLQLAPVPPPWVLTRQILTQNLYGVDLLPEAIAITQLQLWLNLLGMVDATTDLPPLPDLDFNITTGNALVGFIRVDAESFDKITPKRLRQSPATEIVWQGNLLQPLTAANYRDTLAEKKIRVEHYQAQTRAMGTEGGIPEYAQTDFLRDRVEAVNQAVQQKLDTLLYETFSRKLGIQIKEPQISGRGRKRLLTPADIAALHPFHWGFFFNSIIEQQGGFDIVLTHPPDGSLSAKADEFYRQYEALLHPLKIEQSDFRRSRRQILQQFPELAELWSTYAGRIAAVRDYIRRSDDYQLPPTITARRSIPLRTVFTQRCLALAKTESVPPYVH